MVSELKFENKASDEKHQLLLNAFEIMDYLHAES